MFTLLIVDDEPKVGRLVNNLIHWDEMPLSLLGIAHNGKAALDIILKQRADIVITDIRMPDIDGLELIQRTRQKEIDASFIVISGYRHFEYAQSALKYGVADYLIKPIDEDELNQVLHKLCRERESTQVQKHQVAQLRRNAEQGKAALQQQFIRTLRQGERMNMEETNSAFGLAFVEGLFEVLFLKIDRNFDAPRNGAQESLILEKVAHIVYNSVQDITAECVVACEPAMTLVAILNYPPQRETEVRQARTELMPRLTNYLNEYEEYSITIGYTNTASEMEVLPGQLQQATLASQERLLQGPGHRIKYTAAMQSDAPFDWPLNQQKAFRGAVETGGHEGLRPLVTIPFDEMQRQHFPAQAYYDFAERLVDLFWDALPGADAITKADALSQWKNDVAQAHSLARLMVYLTDAMTRAMEDERECRHLVDRRPIQKAMRYINKNYHQKITLEDVAADSGFNATYFSELFKKETGEKFSDYLLGIRMEAAKELLRDTKEPIYTVADRVGYKDSKFFSQQFTRFVSVKPAEYRKLYY